MLFPPRAQVICLRQLLYLHGLSQNTRRDRPLGLVAARLAAIMYPPSALLTWQLPHLIFQKKDAYHENLKLMCVFLCHIVHWAGHHRLRDIYQFHYQGPA